MPWDALKLDTEHKRFTLDIDLERIKNAPGFDTENWPDMANPQWKNQIHTYYGMDI